jgi:hypothetical protein
MTIASNTVLRLGLRYGSSKFHKEHARWAGSAWEYPEKMYPQQDIHIDKNGEKYVLVDVPAGVIIKVKRLNIRKRDVTKSVAIAIHKTYNKNTGWDYPSVEFLLSVDEFEKLNLEFV